MRQSVGRPVSQAVTNPSAPQLAGEGKMMHRNDRSTMILAPIKLRLLWVTRHNPTEDADRRLLPTQWCRSLPSPAMAVALPIINQRNLSFRESPLFWTLRFRVLKCQPVEAQTVQSIST
jgi:hypothetical protein